MLATVGLEHDLVARRGRVRVVLPEGFEYHEAELASSRTRTGGAAIALDGQDRHAFLAITEMTGRGVVHRRRGSSHGRG